MKVVELLEARRQNWRELESLCSMLESRRKSSLGAEAIARFSSLYRSACADLALADAYQLPQYTVDYLHQLVARGHNQLYRGQRFRFRRWLRVALVELPQRLFQDGCLRLAAFLFWGVFLSSALLAWTNPQWAEDALGEEQVQGMEEMYSDESAETHFANLDLNERSLMFGFYVRNNAGIGLQCFITSLVLIGVLIMISNAYTLGTVFGYMATVPQADNFYTFVTAHGPFELTAIVLSTAAGMRLGMGVIKTNGLTRRASIAKAVNEAVPTAILAVVLFGLAAVIEAFISPAPIPYWIKAAVAMVTSALLMFYFVLLGYPRRAS
jgi:uncharacterized membrane protein SpoIIM required for sporulation